MKKDYAPPTTTRAKPSQKKASKASASKKGTTKPGGKSSNKEQEIPPVNKFKLISILILLAGGFGFGLYALQQLPETDNPATKEPTQQNTPTKIEKKVQKNEPQATPEQRFKFYDILPESEVIPPKVETYQFKEKGAKKDYLYIVQTGSFRSRADAERQKATVAFQGLKAQIKAVKNDQGTTWYRVSTGPFKTRSKMNSALDKLVNIGIEPLVKKIKVEQ